MSERHTSQPNLDNELDESSSVDDINQRSMSNGRGDDSISTSTKAKKRGPIRSIIPVTTRKNERQYDELAQLVEARAAKTETAMKKEHDKAMAEQCKKQEELENLVKALSAKCEQVVAALGEANEKLDNLANEATATTEKQASTEAELVDAKQNLDAANQQIERLKKELFATKRDFAKQRKTTKALSSLAASNRKDTSILMKRFVLLERNNWKDLAVLKSMSGEWDACVHKSALPWMNLEISACDDQCTMRFGDNLTPVVFNLNKEFTTNVFGPNDCWYSYFKERCGVKAAKGQMVDSLVCVKDMKLVQTFEGFDHWLEWFVERWRLYMLFCRESAKPVLLFVFRDNVKTTARLARKQEPIAASIARHWDRNYGGHGDVMPKTILFEISGEEWTMTRTKDDEVEVIKFKPGETGGVFSVEDNMLIEQAGNMRITYEVGAEVDLFVEICNADGSSLTWKSYHESAEVE